MSNIDAYKHLNLNFSFKDMDDELEYLLKQESKYYKIIRIAMDDVTIDKITGALDTFFTGTHCKKFLITSHDKQFFGVRVYPDMPPDEALRLAMSAPRESSVPICVSYYIELDAKIFDPMMYMFGREIASLILYAVYYTLYDSALAGIAFGLARHCDEKGISITPDRITSGAKLCFQYGFNDALMKNGNPIYILNGETVKNEDRFLSTIGYNVEMYNCLKKLYQNISMLHSYPDQTYYILTWAFNVISDYDHYRIPAYKTLLRAADLTGSVLEKDQILKCAKALQRTDSMIIEGVESYENPNTIQTSSLGYLQVRTFKSEIPIILNQLGNDELTIDQIADIRLQISTTIAELEKIEQDKLNPREYKEVWDTLQAYRGLLDHCYEKKVMADHSGGRMPIMFVNL